MIIPLMLPQIDFKGLSVAVAKELRINPFAGTDTRKYSIDDYRVWLNALRLKEDYDLKDFNVQKLFHIGYVIVAREEYLTKVGCKVESNILDGVGIFVGSLADWKNCIISLMVEDNPHELRTEIFSIYNHLTFLKFGYLFDGYKINGTILLKV